MTGPALMRMNTKEYLTKEKYNELIKELEYLKKVKRKEVAEDLEYAKSLGDLSENAEYHEARDMQANTEDRIAKIEALLKTAEIISTHRTEVVSVGSVVTVQKGEKGEERKYTIVGSEEADVSQGKLSITSPMGQAMLGKKKGEIVTVHTPSGKSHYTIITIA